MLSSSVPLRRSLLAFSGPQAHELLQGLVTCDLSMLTGDNTFTSGAFLNEKGRVISHSSFYLLKEGSSSLNIPPDSYIVESHPQLHRFLLLHIKVHKLRTEVQLTDLAALGDELVVEVGPQEETGGTVVAKGEDGRLGKGVERRVVFQSTLESSLQALNRYAACRLVSGFGEGGEVFELPPHVANLDCLNSKEEQEEESFVNATTIGWSKGCYLGQELVTRTQHKGMVRKRVLPLLVSSSKDALMELMEDIASSSYEDMVNVLSERVSCFSASEFTFHPTQAPLTPHTKGGLTFYDETTGKKVGASKTSTTLYQEDLGFSPAIGTTMANLPVSLVLNKQEGAYVLLEGRKEEESEDESHNAFVATPLLPSCFRWLNAETGKVKLPPRKRQ